MRVILIFCIRIYQAAISPFLGNNCRFAPSCSSYGIEAISKHGCLKGMILTTKRILKCHPFHPGGVDLVPENCVSGNAINSNTKHF